MVPDDMAEEGFVTLLIIVDNGPAARKLRAGTDHGDVMLVRALHDLGDEAVIMEGMINNQDRGEELIADGSVDGAGGLIVFFMPVEIQRGALTNRVFGKLWAWDRQTPISFGFSVMKEIPLLSRLQCCDIQLRRNIFFSEAGKV